MKKYCIVVDPFASSALLATTLLENNITPIAVLTSGVKSISENYPYVIEYAEEKEDAFFEEIAKFPISFVIGGTEVSINIADRLAVHFTPELANPSSSSAARAYKYEMQEAVRREGLNAVKQFKMFQLELTEAQKEKLTSWGFPVIVKPNLAAGSAKVAICNNFQEVEEAAATILHKRTIFSSKIADCALVQECLSGPEYAINSMSLHGKTMIASIFYNHKILHNQKNIYRYTEFIDPANDKAKKITVYVKEALKAAELNNGFGHSEVFLTPEPYLIEINPRVAGASGTLNKVALACTGENQITLMAQSINDPEGFLKRCEEPTPPIKKFGRVLYLQNWNPKVIGELDIKNLKKFPSFLDAMQLKAPGTSMGELNDLLDTVAYVVLAHPSNEQVVADSEAIFQLEKEGKLF